MSKIGVLLVNLGTPKSCNPKDVRRYLTEFLTDERVIDLPYLMRQILVRGIIIPKRYKDSAAAYRMVWNLKRGSPLLFHSQDMTGRLQDLLGDAYEVRLAMRYQNPSLKKQLHALQGVSKLIVLPLFPQYASATTGSIHNKICKIIATWDVIPELRLISRYEDHPLMIDAFAQRGEVFDISAFDHVLFSYHGLPQRQIKKHDRYGKCLQSKGCCKAHPQCYAAQCFSTTQALVKRLNLTKGAWSHSYQSRLGKKPWMQPYTDTVIKALAAQGVKKILVFCPSFTADCLETIEEIGGEYAQLFIDEGGELLQCVPSLNDHPQWVLAMKELICDVPNKENVVHNQRLLNIDHCLTSTE